MSQKEPNRRENSDAVSKVYNAPVLQYTFSVSDVTALNSTREAFHFMRQWLGLTLAARHRARGWRRWVGPCVFSKVTVLKSPRMAGRSSPLGKNRMPDFRGQCGESEVTTTRERSHKDGRVGSEREGVQFSWPFHVRAVQSTFGCRCLYSNSGRMLNRDPPYPASLFPTGRTMAL